jgi:uncharacterized protein YkwD
VPGRALIKTLLIALALAVGVMTASATAATKVPTASIALGVKEQAANAKASAKRSGGVKGSTKSGKRSKKAKATKKRKSAKAAKSVKASKSAKTSNKAKKAKKAKKPKRAKRNKGAKARKTSTKTPARPTSQQASTPAPAVPAAPAAPTECANTTLMPDASNLPLVQAALVCLHNLIRSQNGVGTLAENAALAAAAAGHNNDMIQRGYFAHDTPEGRTFVDRILAARYAREDEAWSLGENLAWGSGTRATPAEIMRAWMESPGHRANILKADYRELGLAVQLGTPTGAPNGVTVAAEFGTRF